MCYLNKLFDGLVVVRKPYHTMEVIICTYKLVHDEYTLTCGILLTLSFKVK